MKFGRLMVVFATDYRSQSFEKIRMVKSIDLKVKLGMKLSRKCRRRLVESHASKVFSRKLAPKSVGSYYIKKHISPGTYEYVMLMSGMLKI